ncbi:MAG: DUF4236 domain-containing protein [Candidatus Sericytochromatia bacterium]|nr:DUF4236 domain-containing protein [Candidatus Sericytochromatia bacterium]
MSTSGVRTMGWRFRKSVRLLPGISLNLGMGRPSLSFGRRGARVTVDEEGVRTSLGVPGTGVSWSTRSAWKSGQRRQGGAMRLTFVLLALAVLAWLSASR